MATFVGLRTESNAQRQVVASDFVVMRKGDTVSNDRLSAFARMLESFRLSHVQLHRMEATPKIAATIHHTDEARRMQEILRFFVDFVPRFRLVKTTTDRVYLALRQPAQLTRDSPRQVQATLATLGRKTSVRWQWSHMPPLLEVTMRPPRDVTWFRRTLSEATRLSEQVLAAAAQRTGQAFRFYFLLAGAGERLSPSHVFHRRRGQSTNEVAIWVRPLEDVYMVLTDYDTAKNMASVATFINPLVSYVWWGTALLVVALLLAMRPRMPTRGLLASIPSRVALVLGAPILGVFLTLNLVRTLFSDGVITKTGELDRLSASRSSLLRQIKLLRLDVQLGRMTEREYRELVTPIERQAVQVMEKLDRMRNQS